MGKSKKHKRIPKDSLKRQLKYSVRHNGIVTSVSIKTPVVALFLTLSECAIDPHAFMKKAVKKCLSTMTTADNEYLSEIVTYKLLESLMDEEVDIKQFYKYAAILG